MKNRRETLIIMFIICIVFTPILVCAGLKGWGALIFIWIFFVFYWYLFYGKDSIEHNKIKKEIEKKKMEVLPKLEEERRNYENNLPDMNRKREMQRRKSGLITDSSFKEYMHSFGFDVEGTIDIGRLPTWNEYKKGKQIIYPSVQGYEKYSEITIVTHKSMKELKAMGIIDVKQLLGKYFMFFGYRIDNKNGGFYCGKTKKYNSSFELITIEDPHNMCATVRYSINLDKNININWSKDYIYHIERQPIKKTIAKTNKNELDRWLPESINAIDLSSSFNTVDVLYWKYTVYRDSGSVIRDGGFYLSDNEKKFVMLASEANSGIKKYYGRDGIQNCVEHYQIAVDDLTKMSMLLK